MELTTSEIIEVIHTLPSIEREKIRKTLEEDKKQRLKEHLERYKKARKWLDDHSEEYMNQWVCLEGDQLIAHSIDGDGIYQKAKDAGIETPFIHHIVEEPKFVLGEGYELVRD